MCEDKNAIGEHTAFYDECRDDARLDEWVATFTEDRVFELGGAPDTVGPEALHAMITAMTTVGFVHMTLNHRIAVTGDIARFVGREFAPDVGLRGRPQWW